MKKYIFFTVVAWVLAVVSISAQDINAGLVSHYPLNGDANDAVGGRNGVITGATPTVDRNGISNSAYAFDGNSTYITIADATGAFELQETGYSVSAWIYVTDPQTMSTGRILSYGGRENNGWQIHTYTWPNEISSALCDATTNYYQASTTISKGYWLHTVSTYVGGVTSLYINGVLENISVHTYSPNTADHPLVLGASSYNLSWGFTGSIDDVRLYDRVITKEEINILADNSAVFYSDFEDQSLQPNGGAVSSELDLANGGTVTVVANPEKDVVNGSDYVIKSTTLDNSGTYSRAEYSSQWSNQFKIDGYKHLYKWKVYFPAGYTDVDNIDYDWDVIAQFVTHPCANYDGDGGIYDHFGDEICGTGGIFNEVRIDKDNFNQYGFTFRAEPNCDTIPWVFPEDEWVEIAMEVFYSTNFDGYYGVYINGTLLGGESAVRTLPESFISDGTCDMRWKVGAYHNWTDAVKTERSYYIDDLELYIDKDIEDVCPECESTSSNIIINQSGTEGNPHTVSGTAYTSKVIVTGNYVDVNTCSFTQGIQVNGSNVVINNNDFTTSTDTAFISNRAESVTFTNNTVTGTGHVISYTPSQNDMYGDNVTINNNTYNVTNGKFNDRSLSAWRRKYGFDK